MVLIPELILAGVSWGELRLVCDRHSFGHSLKFCGVRTVKSFLIKPNVSYLCTVLFIACSDLVGIVSKQFTIDSYEGWIFLISKRRPAFNEESQTCQCLG